MYNTGGAVRHIVVTHHRNSEVMNEENRDDGVSVRELFIAAWRYKWLLMALPVVAAVLAAVWVSMTLRPTWEASAVIEVGHIGQGAGQTMLAEPIANVMVRIKQPSFVKGALNNAGIKSGELLNEARAFYGTLKVTQAKGAELIDIKLRGASPEMANSLIRGVLVNLQKTHSEMMSATIERNVQQLKILTADIQKVSAETAMLKNKLLASHNWNAFDATLSATILKDKSNDLRAMISTKLALEEQLSSSRTYTTRLVDEVYVSEEPVPQNKPLVIGIAILIGLVGAVVIAFGHNALTSKSANIVA